jgi:hypothetical protein
MHVVSNVYSERERDSPKLVGGAAYHSISRLRPTSAKGAEMKKILALSAAAIVLASGTAPIAKADWHGGRGYGGYYGGWHGGYYGGWRGGYRGWYGYRGWGPWVYPPPVVYAPPPAYYAPPPVYYPPPYYPPPAYR